MLEEPAQPNTAPLGILKGCKTPGIALKSLQTSSLSVTDFILSDDLTGASGVASMVDGSISATINLSSFDSKAARGFSCIAINLEARERGKPEVSRLARDALGSIGGSWAALRIDSALRSAIVELLQPLLSRGKILITDTIPEYGRRTINGRTIIENRETNLWQMLEELRGLRDSRIAIADSQTESDLRSLAAKCINEDWIPVDPGPLISMVVKERQHLLKSEKRTGPGIGHTGKVAYVIGTKDGTTFSQLNYMRRLGFKIRRPGDPETARVCIFTLDLRHESILIEDAFVKSLQDYDALVLSGGATASFLLEKANFDYIVNHPQLQPLVSCGTVKGGLFDGKLIILKGGFIGDEKTYKTILDWLKQD
jgi:D-threonate/D-erythronate kinase